MDLPRNDPLSERGVTVWQAQAETHCLGGCSRSARPGLYGLRVAGVPQSHAIKDRLDGRQRRSSCVDITRLKIGRASCRERV